MNSLTDVFNRISNINLAALIAVHLLEVFAKPDKERRKKHFKLKKEFNEKSHQQIIKQNRKIMARKNRHSP